MACGAATKRTGPFFGILHVERKVGSRGAFSVGVLLACTWMDSGRGTLRQGASVALWVEDMLEPVVARYLRSIARKGVSYMLLHAGEEQMCWCLHVSVELPHQTSFPNLTWMSLTQELPSFPRIRCLVERDQRPYFFVLALLLSKNSDPPVLTNIWNSIRSSRARCLQRQCADLFTHVGGHMSTYRSHIQPSPSHHTDEDFQMAMQSSKQNCTQLICG